MDNRNWKPPDRLGFPSPRPVRLTAQGIAVSVLAAMLVIGAVVLGIFLSRIVRRETEANRLLNEQGITADAVITRHWRASDKSSTPWVAYRFEYEGSIYSGSVRAPLDRWRALSVGGALPLRFVPSRPEISHPIAWESRPMPPWFPYLTAALLAAIGAFLAITIIRQVRLLAEGHPAPGRRTGIRRSKKIVIQYQFQLPDGAVVKGSAGVSKEPAGGEPLCILYDPDNPRRNGLYPLPFVRLG